MSTILEVFKEKEKEIGVINSLKFLNEYISNLSEISFDIENEILDFGDYFVDNYEDDTEEERFKVFGIDDALILQVYDAICDNIEIENDFYEECETILTTIDRPIQKEMENLYESIMLLPGNKNISCDFLNNSDSKCGNYHFSCEISENLNKEQIFQLKSILAKAINEECIIILDLLDKKIATAFITLDKRVKTVVPRYIKKIHNVDAISGENLKYKHKGYKYIEANKLIDSLVN